MARKTAVAGILAARKEVFIRMRKITAVVAGALAVAAIAAPSAMAGNAHFIKTGISGETAHHVKEGVER